jgi:flagellar biogenesis protein FliO
MFSLENIFYHVEISPKYNALLHFRIVMVKSLKNFQSIKIISSYSILLNERIMVVIIHEADVCGVNRKRRL